MASEELDTLVANLRRLQLRHAANSLDDLLRDAARLKLGHLGFLARVVENEVLHRTETATNRRIQEAHFRELRRIEDYDFKAQPSLDRKMILDLAELGFLDRQGGEVRRLLESRQDHALHDAIDIFLRELGEQRGGRARLGDEAVKIVNSLGIEPFGSRGIGPFLHRFDSRHGASLGRSGSCRLSRIHRTQEGLPLSSHR